MLITLVALNSLCLVAVAFLLVRLWRPAASPDVAASFATVLAALRPIGLGGLPQADGGTPAAVQEGAREQLSGEMALSDRLAVIRHMLQEKTVEETAAATRVAQAAVRALYRTYGRHEGEAC